MKKKAFALVAAAAALALSACMLAGCSSSSSSSASASASATEFNKLIVGFDAEYPPYGYVADDGSYTGFDLELAAEVAQRNGWEFEAVAIDWDSKDGMLDSGQINCIWNGFTFEGREDKYAWSQPYMYNAQVVMVKADSTIATREDLADKAVLTQAGSAGLALLEGDEADLNKTFKGGSVQTIADYTNALMQLESGAIDALVCDYSVAMNAMAKNPDAYKIAVTLSEESYAVGFKLGNDAPAKTVSETLAAMDKDGFVKALCEKYADQGISYDNWILGSTVS